MSRGPFVIETPSFFWLWCPVQASYCDRALWLDSWGSRGRHRSSAWLSPHTDDDVTGLTHVYVMTVTLMVWWWQSLAARQRSRYLRFARPPQERRLIESRTQTMKQANASALVRSDQTILAYESVSGHGCFHLWPFLLSICFFFLNP